MYVNAILSGGTNTTLTTAYTVPIISQVSQNPYRYRLTMDMSHTHANAGGSGVHTHTFAGNYADIDVMQPYVAVNRWHKIGAAT